MLKTFSWLLFACQEPWCLFVPIVLNGLQMFSIFLLGSLILVCRERSINPPKISDFSFLYFNKKLNHPPADFNGKIEDQVPLFLRLVGRQHLQCLFMYLFIMCTFSFTVGWSWCNWCSITHTAHTSPLKKSAFHSFRLHLSYSTIISTSEHDHSARVSPALCFCTVCEPTHGRGAVSVLTLH